MSIERVQAYLQNHAPDIDVTVLSEPTATVAEAAQAFGVSAGQIAKTLSLRTNSAVILLVMAGDIRLNNQKFKQLFGVKPSMLKAHEVEPLTGFKPGGVCPFAPRDNVKVYCDISLKAYDYVLPAGGDAHSGVKIAPQRLSDICGADWVDVGKTPDDYAAQ